MGVRGQAGEQSRAEAGAFWWGSAGPPGAHSAPQAGTPLTGPELVSVQHCGSGATKGSVTFVWQWVLPDIPSVPLAPAWPGLAGPLPCESAAEGRGLPGSGWAEGSPLLGWHVHLLGLGAIF